MSRDLFSKATLPGQLMLPAGLAPPAAAENNTQTTPEGIGSLYSSKGNFHKRRGKKTVSGWRTALHANPGSSQ